MSCIEIVALAVAGVAASATTSGVESDIVGGAAGCRILARRCPPLALFAR